MSRPLRVTILGGTGTLGQALVAQLLDTSPNCEITIVSRDEHKQAAMKKRYPQCRFVVGDIRDAGSIRQTFVGRDVVFHVAALKHVDILEACPMESIKTNVLATEQMARLAISQKVPRFVFSSTDKAVDPINTYGYSKALSEKLLWNFNREQSGTQFSVYRWGNVLGSQGSAIPFFIDTLLKESKVYLTDLEMTRYWIPIEWAVRYMLRTFPDAKLDQAMIPPNMKAASVFDLVTVLSEMLGLRTFQIVKIPIRPGEKIHEAMHSQHSEAFQTSETAPRYTTEELQEMLMPFVASRVKVAA